MSALVYLKAVGDVAKVGMCATVLLNTLLIYITFYHIKNISSAYKFLIFLLTITGMVFSILESLVHPFMHSYNASFAYFSIDPMFGASRDRKLALVVIYSVIYVVIICLIAIQFVYRYWVMTGSRKLGSFHRWKSLSWLGYTSMFSLLWIVSVTQCVPDAYSLSYYRDEFRDKYGVDVDDVPSLLVVAYEKGATESMRLNSILCLAGVSCVLLTQYIIIVYCGSRVQSLITASISTTSSRTYSIQRQLFKTLVLQITAPSVFYQLPVLLLCLIPYLDLEFSFPSGVMVSFFSLYPAVDSLILMAIVGEYKLAVNTLVTSALKRIVELLEKSQRAAYNTTSVVEKSKAEVRVDTRI